MIHGAMPSWRLLTALRPSIDVSMNLEPLQAQCPGRRGECRRLLYGAAVHAARVQSAHSTDCSSVRALTVEPILILRMRRSHARSVGREE